MAVDVIEQISDCLKNKKNFLLSGGAGSGKTYSLIKTLHKVYESDAAPRVACITYTNVAADEIKKRSPYSKLWVSTIHDFLWEVIKGFQKNLALSVITLIKNNNISYSGETPVDNLCFSTVKYENYRRLEEGIISHDDLLKLAEFMFNNYSLLSKILCDKFDYIFIDEYQDTQKEVVNIFLEYIYEKARGKLCVGFFGDKMQSIYENGIGDIQSFVDNERVLEIKKTDNYRCSQNAIVFLNKLRNDLSQQPSKKNQDGSIANKSGSIKFLYSDSDFDLSTFKTSTYGQNWNFNDSEKTKLLFLTHRLISRREGWDGIISAYTNNDMLLGNEPDRLANYLLNLGGILYWFQKKKYDKVLEIMQRKIRSINDKREIGTFLTEICKDLNVTISSTIESFHDNKLLRKDDKLIEYFEKNVERWENIKILSISQAIAYYSYYNDYSPYSTQHGIKGAEFDNVLVVMDNGRWNNYNFKYFFEGTDGKESIIERTSKIFYVCCSRAIDNLVVYYPKPSMVILARAKEFFGENNVISL